MQTLQDFEYAAELHGAARAEGHTIRQATGCMIAAVCIRERVPLLHDDADFDRPAHCSGAPVLSDLSGEFVKNPVGIGEHAAGCATSTDSGCKDKTGGSCMWGDIMANSSCRVRSIRRRLYPFAAAVVAASVVLAAGGVAAAVAPAASPALVSISQGSGAAPLAAGTALGATAASTQVQISVILKARNLAVLEHRVQAGWQGPYLSTRQFAAQYGQPVVVIAAIVAYLHHFGIATSVYPDGLDISAHGTAAQINAALNVTLTNYRVTTTSANGSGAKSVQTVHGSLKNPKMPATLANPILAILGLSSYAPFSSTVVKSVPQQVAAKVTSKTKALPAGSLSPLDFLKDYHLSQLEAGGAKGQGTTIGIVTLASIDPSVPLAFWNTYLGLDEPASRLTLVPVDGGAPYGAAAGTDETDLDVEQSGAIAPKAKVRVYEAPNTDPGFADAFVAAASDNIADTVSVSWGESETYVAQSVALGLETPAYQAVFDEAFLELGAQGQSSFASSGDSGAYDAAYDSGTTNLAVDTPADSPYITAAGGTTLPGTQVFPVADAYGNPTGATESVDIPTERAWSWDYLYPLYNALGLPDEATAASLAGVGPAGDGGGYSTLEARPSYQQGISSYQARKYFNPTGYTQIAPGLTEPTSYTLNPAPALSSGYQSSGRGVPDVSTNADPETGYAVYDPAVLGGFAQYGGTSFVSPQLNGSTAVIDSYVGHRVGFWNPKVYAFANSGSSPFTPLNSTTVYSGKKYFYATSASGQVTALPGVSSNNNLFYTGKAGATWNPATGLGVPNLTELAHAFAHR
jgi:kumamolisin